MFYFKLFVPLFLLLVILYFMWNLKTMSTTSQMNCFLGCRVWVLFPALFGSPSPVGDCFHLRAFHQINCIILTELCVCVAEVQQLAVIRGG